MGARSRVPMIRSASFAALLFSTAAVDEHVSVPGHAQTPTAGSPSALEGTWSGTLKVPGAEVPVLLTLARSGDRWSGSLRLRDYGAVASLTGIRVSGHSISVGWREKIGLVGATLTGYAGTLDPKGHTLAGSLTEGSIPLLLTRDDEVGKPGAGMAVEVLAPAAVFRAHNKTHIFPARPAARLSCGSR